MKNHQSQPTGAKTFPEANAMFSNGSSCGQGRGYGCGRGCSHGHKLRCNVYYSPNYKKTTGHYHNKASGEKMAREKVDLIVFPRMLKIHVIDVVQKGIGHVPVVHLNTLLSFIRHP